MWFLTILPMSIFGPASLACWIYALLYWLVFGVEPGYGGYDVKGVKLMTANGKKSAGSLNGVNGTSGINGVNDANGTARL